MRYRRESGLIVFLSSRRIESYAIWPTWVTPWPWLFKVNMYMFRCVPLTRQTRWHENQVCITENKEYIGDSFIRGLRYLSIRTRLLVNKTLTLDEAIQQSRSLEEAQRNAESHASPHTPANAARADSIAASTWQPDSSEGGPEAAAAIRHDRGTGSHTAPPCFFCD